MVRHSAFAARYAAFRRHIQDLPDSLDRSRHTMLELMEPPYSEPMVPESLEVEMGSRCVKGSRKSNEDRCYCDASNGLFFVADGMGGHRGGSQASQILVETLPELLTDLPSHDPADVERAIMKAIDVSQQRMACYAERDPRLYRMGATLAVVKVVDDFLYMTHLGDCRIYLVREARIHRLTDDQTFVQVVVNAGMLTEEEARRDPRRHLVLNAVAANGVSEPTEVQRLQLRPGDRIILVSDGLTGAVSDPEILETVLDHPNAQNAADELVLEALHQGSRDNVACIAIRVP